MKHRAPATSLAATRWSDVAIAALGAIVLVAITLLACSHSGPLIRAGAANVDPSDSTDTQSTSAVASPTTASEVPVHSAAAPAAVSATPVQSLVAAQTQGIIAGQPSNSVSVAALNVATGAQFFAGNTSGMWTASMYKLFILEALLYQRQQGGQQLSGSDLAQAMPMIEQSDNDAGYDVFERVGENAGLSRAAAAFGMTHTVPGRTDPTFTTTGAEDYLILLKNLVTDGPLNAYSRSTAIGLMQNVEADQRWGSARSPTPAPQSRPRTGGSRSTTATVRARTTTADGSSPAP
ncbi:MAG: serine hydrolase, partial [Actinobacteria bacterium]|nr:serine hydrolase [Actinomycetota bacterium]